MEHRKYLYIRFVDYEKAFDIIGDSFKEIGN